MTIAGLIAHHTGRQVRNARTIFRRRRLASWAAFDTAARLLYSSGGALQVMAESAMENCG